LIKKQQDRTTKSRKQSGNGMKNKEKPNFISYLSR